VLDKGIRPDGPLVVEFERESGAGHGPALSGVADLPAQQNELPQCGIGRGFFEKFEDLNTLAGLGHDRLAAYRSSLGASPATAVASAGSADHDEQAKDEENAARGRAGLLGEAKIVEEGIRDLGRVP
jgi:hypothetical protein